FKNNYRTDNTVISIAGNFDAEKIMEDLESVFGKWTTKKNPNTSLAVPKYVPTKFTKNKDTEQVHLCLAFPSIERDNPEKYAYTVFNTIFGGGMSSVLFQKIREEHGLTYSIYSYLSQYNKTGVFVIYLGMNPKQTDTVFQLIFEEIRTLMENGVSADLVEKTKQQIISNFIIGTESTVNRMTSNGGSMLLRGKIITQEETIEKIEAVTTEDIKRIINKIFDFERISVAGVGKSEGVDFNSILENIISY
ncbi:MAG: M16 family metallopeptidase, partial [Anaerotignaceae bacterium]